MIKRTYAWRHGQLVELTPDDIQRIPNVMDDIEEFPSPDGRRIRGRAQWREHLKVHDAIELGHSDMRGRAENWEKRGAQFRERVSRGTGSVKEAVPPDGDIRPRNWSDLDKEIGNRLHNRPMPDRKTLIKLSLETARELARRR